MPASSAAPFGSSGPKYRLHTQHAERLQSGVARDGPQAGPEGGMDADARKRVEDPRQRALHRWRRRHRTRGGDIELDRRNDAAGPQHRSLRLQHRRGVGHVHQHETRDDGVVRATRRRLVDVADCEAHALELPLPRADRRLRHGVRRAIDSEDFSGGAYELGKDECHVSRAAAKVEHAHSLANPRSLEQHPRRGPEHRSLVIEPFELRRITAQRILAFGRSHRCLLQPLRKTTFPLEPRHHHRQDHGDTPLQIGPPICSTYSPRSRMSREP